ncbi:MAG: hypothetical protein BWY15_01042 [Firmicutes bacterium ADurb.Bin193]|nr:MAG: hypothetical protein BWY15_01042 [Firmicutes bacterium ADurb.Bin193]
MCGPYRNCGFSDLIYRYDGSFEGFLCCVFESYEKNEIPRDIVSDFSQTSLIFEKNIDTDLQKAQRVLKAIPKRMGAAALTFIKEAFLTCLPKKELYMLLFLRKGFTHGASVMNMLADDVVNKLFKAVRHLSREVHLLKGFVRFSDYGGALAAQIEPKNFVLPLLSEHFCGRYPEETFLIHDKTHSAALIYKPYRCEIIPASDFVLPEACEAETVFRELWRLFYKTIEVEGRHNPKCRMSHMPKRYWKHMTELCCPEKAGAPLITGDKPIKKLT